MPARSRAGGGHRDEAHAAGPRHLHAPGRRRHGVGRAGRGAAHRGTRRVHHVPPARQRRVRRHRRPDDRDHHRRAAHQDRRVGPGAAQYGYPIPIADLVAQFPGVAYVARGAVDRPNAVARTRRYLREAFESQLAGEGFSLVEILTMCPTGWSVPADQGAEYQRDQMTSHLSAGRAARALRRGRPDPRHPHACGLALADARARRPSATRSGRSAISTRGRNQAAHRLGRERCRRTATESCGGDRPISTRSSSATGCRNSARRSRRSTPGSPRPRRAPRSSTSDPGSSSPTRPRASRRARRGRARRPARDHHEGWLVDASRDATSPRRHRAKIRTRSSSPAGRPACRRPR